MFESLIVWILVSGLILVFAPVVAISLFALFLGFLTLFGRRKDIRDAGREAYEAHVRRQQERWYRYLNNNEKEVW